MSIPFREEKDLAMFPIFNQRVKLSAGTGWAPLLLFCSKRVTHEWIPTETCGERVGQMLSCAATLQLHPVMELIRMRMISWFLISTFILFYTVNFNIFYYYLTLYFEWFELDEFSYLKNWHYIEDNFFYIFQPWFTFLNILCK